MSFRKVFRTSLCVSAVLVSLGISQDVSAAPTAEFDVGIAGIAPTIKNYYSSGGDQELGEAEEYLVSILQQLDQENGTNLTAIIAPYANLGIAKVNEFVNIRTEANAESEIAGKLYSGSATDILATEGDWVKIQSGNVEGYIKSEFLAIGTEAEELIEEVSNKYATINTQTLYVREEPSTEAEIVTMVPIEGKYIVEEEQDEWVKILVDDKSGFVSKEYVDVEVEFEYAISIEEELARIAAEEAARVAEEERLAQIAAEAARQEAARRQTTQTTQTTSAPAQTQAQAPAPTQAPPPATSSQGSSTGQAIANYAQQFVGNPYVYGGTSLTNGTDCSGFTSSVYRNMGYSIPRTSGGQAAAAGYAVNIGDRQPGDLMFYPGHVAMYIGNNQIVHASTERTGIIISPMRNPYQVRRVVN